MCNFFRNAVAPSLIDKGLIELRARHSDNGAQIANAYCATALGLEVARISEAVRGR